MGTFVNIEGKRKAPGSRIVGEDSQGLTSKGLSKEIWKLTKEGLHTGNNKDTLPGERVSMPSPVLESVLD